MSRASPSRIGPRTVPSSLKTPPVRPLHCSAIPESNQSARRAWYHAYDDAAPDDATSRPPAGPAAVPGTGCPADSTSGCRYGSGLGGRWSPNWSSSSRIQAGGSLARPGCRSDVRAQSRTEDGMSRPRSKTMSAAGSSGGFSRSRRVNAHVNPSLPSSLRCASWTRRRYAGPQWHPEVRGARLLGPRVHDGLAVKAPGPLRRDAHAARATGVALRVEQPRVHGPRVGVPAGVIGGHRVGPAPDIRTRRERPYRITGLQRLQPPHVTH